MIFHDIYPDVKTLLILGQGESGIAAAALARGIGIKHVIFDLSESPIDDINLAVISPGISIYGDMAVKLKRRGIPVISELEFGWLCCKAPVIAVTGTNGKSTVASLIGAITQTGGFNAHVLGNIGVALSRKAAQMTAEDLAVVEASSFQLEACYEFKPRIAALLNITPDHLDRHRTMEEYVSAKYRIFARQDENDFAVLNADDPVMAEIPFRAESRVYYFSALKRVRGCYAADGKIYFCKDTSRAEDEFICGTRELKLLGAHNLSNALAAAAACTLYGADKESIVKALKEFTGIKHRLEFIRELDGVKYYNDSKGTNIDSTLKAALSMRDGTTLILGGSDKGYEYDALFQGLPPQIAKAVVTGQTKRKITDAAYRCGFKNLYECDTFKAAVLKAREITPAGGSVLLSPACASFDTFRNFEHRGDVFTDIVRSF